MALGPWQIVIILLLAGLLLGGGGRISALMGDFAKGIKAFRKGLEDDGDKALEKRADAAKDVTPKAEGESSKESS
ncbi:MAG: Sec-independent protein translocase TatA [Alphaproteobacteria bacterium]|nr:Sec-independent protein translocase TatA [Alphaproteobacteria bacterium]